jgi:hypothetical protein
MRNIVYTAFLAACVSTAALAQTQTPQRPVEAAPASTASIEARDEWCRKYASWFADQASSPTTRASDLRPTHLVETEINYCKLDPQEYERETVAEITRAAEASS